MSLRLITSLVLMPACFLLANPPTEKLARDLPESGAMNVNVIVRFNVTPGHHQHTLVAVHGGRLLRQLSLVQGAAYRIPADRLTELAEENDVISISPDREVSGLASTAPTYNGAPCDYGWMTVGADTTSNTYHATGVGIGVAVIDSGIDNLADLGGTSGKSRIVYAESFVPGDASTGDAYGHGDHVAGIIGGNGSNSTGSQYTYTVRGIAPAVNFVNLRVLGAQGSSQDSTVIAAIERAIQLKSQYNIRVINLSLGRQVTESCSSDALCQAVQQAWQSGIVVVVAAGNGGRDNSANTYGYGTITVPGNNPFVITVGAMNTRGTLGEGDDRIASYSSKGPTLVDHIAKPDLVAPGNLIFSVRKVGSTLDTSYPANQVPVSAYAMGAKSGQASAYFVLSGTSMATPMVSGAAALMLQLNGSLTPDEVKARLMKTASKFPQTTWNITDPVTGQAYVDESDIFTVGAGYLSIPAALLNQDVLTSPAISPTAVNDGSGNVTLSFNGSVAWGTSAVWGTSVVWGTKAKSVLWGTGAVWGASTAGTPGYGTTAIWGTSVVWGTKRPGGMTIPDAAATLINGE
jgi:serine protease AprX